MSEEKEKRHLRIAIFHCGFVYSGGEVACFAPTLDKEMAYPDFIEEVGGEDLPPPAFG